MFALRALLALSRTGFFAVVDKWFWFIIQAPRLNMVGSALFCKLERHSKIISAEHSVVHFIPQNFRQDWFDVYPEDFHVDVEILFERVRAVLVCDFLGKALEHDAALRRQ